MQIGNILPIAVALAMDAFAVAIATGIFLKTIHFRQFFRLSWHFGLFQALMPIIGWFAGSLIQSYIEQYGHYIAFVLLVLVGLNMIREAFHDEKDKEEKRDPTKGLSLVILSVATSIDALVVGFSISLLNISIWFSALIIGLVAGVFTILGLLLGKKVSTLGRFSRYAEAGGGIILIVIGLKILFEYHSIRLF